MVALVDGVPHTITLVEALRGWLDHQVVVVTRRTLFRVEKAEARLHIVEGLVKAVEMIDAVVKAIRAVKGDDISLKLQKEFYEKSTHPLDTQP